ncbi:PROTEIN PIN-LIKES 3-LIKE ISOFORM X1 [Salix koriyanagi]|uniref:PROTEIN PIN-LIKES 3-LIKE ISOFORM X1 n=1 Tax=Salix koriyanagi TaxID=2511006 RepID=A0A9Q0UDC2_9ROSI|nr:PROTEIN PIN-LIKES 3-LIKE ISOFORM X1 [Salix koriyanagi]
MNNLVFYLFSPALVVSQLGETITFQSLRTLWFMPVNILLTFIIGSILAWILIKITKTPPHLQGLVTGCCSAGNLGNLLLIIVPAVCMESNSPFGDSTICSINGTTYASLSMAVGAIYIWTYVYIIMRIYADKSAEDTGTNQSISDSESYNALLSRKNSGPSGCSKEDELPLTISEEKSVNKFTEKINLKMVFAPATIAAIFGFIIGIVSPIRKLMIGDSAPLRVIDRILAVRNIFLPIIGIGIVKGAHHFGMVESDSLYQFILLLQFALPPAMTVGVIAQLFEAGEGECSVIMLWSYALSALSLTLWSTFYMWLLQ